MQRLSNRSSVDVAHRISLLRQLGGPAREHARLCVHEMFEAQAARTPDHAAIIDGHDELSYRELNERANQVAHELVRLGVGVGSLVGICVERSAEVVVAVLAALKAGAAYVPLDPSYPRERLSFMLEDAAVSALLTTSRISDKLPYAGGWRISLDSDAARIGKQSIENLGAEIAPDDLAYVIYTSGSTGQPKGAMITHRGLANYLKWACEYYEVAKGCGAPLHSSISFDLTVTSLFAPLLVGRSVFLVDDGIEALARAVTARTNYSFLKITPAHLRALNELLPPEKLSGRVRALIVGGEALHFENVSAWRENAPATRIINEYGPTETVVGCCVYEVAPTDPATGAVPIGSAISNTQLYVLDENLDAMSEEEAGELFIGGDGVALGYLNREALTHERFIKNPFGEGTLYRSGDLARARSEGRFEYLGRVDDQVKIRGFRIEPGEIESALRQHAEVSDCAVIARDEASGEKRLVAFVVPNGGSACDATAIAEFLKSRLPDYMVPAAFIQLEELPLTSNGKVDRKSLADCSLASEGTSDYTAPRTALEQELATIWTDVLHLERVGINDNFFDLGGDSILGTLILARAARAGLKLTPTQLFEYQTIAELATVATVAVKAA